MTRKLSRKTSVLNIAALFIGVLTVLVTLATLVRFSSAGQRPSESEIAAALDTNMGWQSANSVPQRINGSAPTPVASPGRNSLDTRPTSPGIPRSSPFVTYNSGGYFPTSMATGDVNDDGIADLVVANWCVEKTHCRGGKTGTLSVFLGNRDGTFQSGVPYLSMGKDPSSVTVADFNGDGNLDVAVANFCGVNGSGCNVGGHGSVSVLLGNGDGTLRPAVSYALAAIFPKSVAVGDFNQDGKLDLVVADCVPVSFCQDTVGVLLGNGDGSFQPEVTYLAGPGDCGNSVVVADFDADGKSDVAFAEPCQGFVSILLGGGDGTFGPAVTYRWGGGPQFLAVGDFNRDGNIDLAGADLFGFDASVLLGRGNGTFDTALGYPTGGFSAASVAVEDFNEDGKPDLAVTNGCSVKRTPCTTDNSVAVFIGKGDGTFQLPVNYDSEGLQEGQFIPKLPVIARDLNGDGHLDLVVGNMCSDFTCKTGSIAVLLGNGDGTFQAQVIPNHYASSTALTSNPNPSALGQLVTFTATVTSAGPVLPTGKVKFLDGGKSLGTATLSGGVAKRTRSTLAVGTHPITAQYLGDAASDKSTSNAVGQVVQ